MPSLLTSLGGDQLSTPEKLELVQQIWESLEDAPKSPMSHDELLELLRQREEEHKAHPEEAIPWEQVEAEIYARWGRVTFRPMAQDELDQAVEWYEQRQQGLGIDLAIAVEHVLERAVNQPDFYPLVGDGKREGMVQGFPYCVYYQENSGQLVVWAILRNARDPAVWQRRG